MRVCVFGLWHLGCVTAAYLARGGHEMIGLDPDAAVIGRLQQGEPPIFEPQLADLTTEGLAAGKLRFTTNVADALAGVDLVWVTFDTLGPTSSPGMATPTIVDAGWFLAATLQHHPGIAYAAVGLPWTAD